MVEVFGDQGVVSYGNYMAAFPEVMRSFTLLDLRGSGAMRAGTVAAIAKCAHATSQPWSRYFYEEGDFGSVDGLLYRNAHNDGSAILLYERAQDALAIDREHILRLDHPDTDFQYLIQSAIQENNLMLGTSS